MAAKVAVCIPSLKDGDPYLEELLSSLDRQTFKDFFTYIVTGLSPIGKAKSHMVKLALENDHQYVCVIDGDDLVEPTYLEKMVERLDKGDVDWVFTWGKLFGAREGYIHSSLELFPVNKRPAQFMAKSDVFKSCNYDPEISWAEDLSLWNQIDAHGFKGDVVEEELYLRRWHDSNLTSSQRHFRFHIPAYVHLPVSEKYMACAFTQKIVKLSKMLLSMGHEVYIYGAEGSDVPCTEFIQTHALADIAREWGDGDNRFEIGYDYKNGQFRHDFNGPKTLTTHKFYANCILEINKRKRPDDFLFLMQGVYHQPIAQGVNLYLTCEPGIGYRGSLPSSFRAFESHYLQSFTYGSEHPYESINGSYYDRVIPNYFDPKDFTFSDTPQNYYLYIGRMITRKGVWTAIKATEKINAKLILVGQADEEIDISKLPPHCTFLGFADIEERKKLLSGAIATFTPTIYLEAFAGTHVESMLSGTPPITTNFGVFPGTIPDYYNGIVGFRCDTLRDFVSAALKAKDVDRNLVREWGSQFLMENVAPLFSKWFNDLYDVWESTQDENLKGWHRV